MMRVMIALALPALASGATCAQDVCCAPNTGKCTGNAGGTGDVVCGAGTFNKGVGTAGTDVAACCVADVTGKCTGNTGGTGDVACGAGKINKGAGTAGTDAAACCDTACAAGVCTAGYNTKTGFAAIVGADLATCCDPDTTGMCSGNGAGTGDPKDVVCGAGTINKGVFTVGTDVAACCGPACKASVCAAAEVVTKANFAKIGGTDEQACCDDVITGKCTGNTGGTGDVACGAGKANKGVGTAGTDAAACCDTACAATVCAAPGFSTKTGFAAIVGATTTLCCDVTGMCSGNTDATTNFKSCSATSTLLAVGPVCTPAAADKGPTSGAATATVAASALALVAALL